MSAQTKTAAILVIGDEILSGRTHDSNTRDIAQKLGSIGIQVLEARVIPDVVDVIVSTTQHLKTHYDYVFTTGGIGPTHDDKTAEAMAKAFNTPLKLNAEAYEKLVAHYGGAEHMNEGRTKMAMIPADASLIDNPVSTAPGFKLENVFVFAGVPKIMNAMLDGVLPTLQGGPKMHSVTLNFNVGESHIAPILEQAERENAGIQIGSYPKFSPKGQEVAVVVRSTNLPQAQTIAHFIEHSIKDLKVPQPSPAPTETLEQRNARVEADKAWETSLTRRFIIAGITYATVCLYLPLLGVERPWLHALVPVAGYLLSTLSLPYAKRMWLKKK